MGKFARLRGRLGFARDHLVASPDVTEWIGSSVHCPAACRIADSALSKLAMQVTESRALSPSPPPAVPHGVLVTEPVAVLPAAAGQFEKLAQTARADVATPLRVVSGIPLTSMGRGRMLGLWPAARRFTSRVARAVDDAWHELSLRSGLAVGMVAMCERDRRASGDALCMDGRWQVRDRPIETGKRSGIRGPGSLLSLSSFVGSEHADSGQHDSRLAGKLYGELQRASHRLDIAA